MTVKGSTPDFDAQVRRQIYEHAVDTGLPPRVEDTAEALSQPSDEINSACRRLAASHVLVLQQDGEILMAPPFSTVPTAFHVEVGSRLYWANCIWDALGIPAMLDADARIVSACGDCSEPLITTVQSGTPRELTGTMHIAVPAGRWWDNVAYT